MYLCSLEGFVRHLHNMTAWSVDNPAQDTVITVELWVIWAVDRGLTLHQNNSPAL